MDNYLIKVDIGCGNRKAEGFIGVDRIKMPGVDIVADLNQGLPFEDNSVDVLYASHSLEHLNSLERIVSEIYRVCKHKGIVMILAPYYNTTLNMANIYHKIVFNEETFRFFTKNPMTNIPIEQYRCPHALTWGLGESDNSQLKVELELLSMEFFYFEAFRNLSESEKINARRSLINVCDQIYYVLAVNKSNKAFNKEERENLIKSAQELEPIAIKSLRERDKKATDTNSILTDIKKPLIEWQEKHEYQTRINLLEKSIQEQTASITNIKKDIESINIEIQNKIQHLNFLQSIFETKIHKMDQNMQILLRQVHDICQKVDSISAVVLELMRARENRNRIKRTYGIYKRKSDLFSALFQSNSSFIDGLILKCDEFNCKSILGLSATVPYDDYFEYHLTGYGDKIHFFIIANIISKLFVEVVQNGEITNQEIINIDHEGHYYIKTKTIKGRVDIRFKILDNKSIIRLLEIRNRCFGLVAKKALAAFID